MNRYLFYIACLLNFSFSQELSNGLMLYTPYNGPDSSQITTYLTDENLNIINSWNHEYPPASMAYLTKDSTLWYPSRVPIPTMDSGGVGGRIQHIDWNNNILWDFRLSNDSLQHHHDIEILPNGNILILLWEKKSLQDALMMGREVIESPIQQMWSEAIYEIEPIGTDSANIVWEWHLWDHLIQDIYPSLENYGEIHDHPELLNINLGVVGFGPAIDNADWIHYNSIHYNGELDQIILSSRMMNEIYIIDHSTSSEEAASHSGGNYDKGGDFLYRWGNPQNYVRGTNQPQILNSQHSVNWIQSSYPGAGNILIFNNFHYGQNSAVIEISLPIQDDGTYHIENGLPYEPYDWEWMYYNGNNITGLFQSGAFRLYNGNTFITEANEARMFEVTQDGEVVYNYSFGDFNEIINRAQKYPPDYLYNYLMGDINNDQLLNLLDIITIINLIINEQPFNQVADSNNDYIIDIIDLINFINIILSD